MKSAIQWMSDNGLPPDANLLAALEARDREVTAKALRDAAHVTGKHIDQLRIDGWRDIADATIALTIKFKQMADRAERGES